MPKPQMPDVCYAYVASEPDTVTIIKFGEKGYYKTDYKGGKETAMKLNEGLDVTEEQMECMIAGSMFGWHCPAAHPSMRTYDKITQN